MWGISGIPQQMGPHAAERRWDFSRHSYISDLYYFSSPGIDLINHVFHKTRVHITINTQIKI